MCATYPISFSALWQEKDDTADGVIVMRAASSRLTSRTFERPNRLGNSAPYYEYRDTAMCRTAPFKPEWIAPLRVVSNDDPNNSDVIYNNGHLLHQQTFFVGPVNFYWIVRGVKYCREMNTGDSNIISPYVPHSFSIRRNSEPGYIVAVTYGAQVRRALDECTRMPASILDSLAGDLRDPRIFHVRLRRMMAEESITEEEVVFRLLDSGLSLSRIEGIFAGERPTQNELLALSRILRIRTKDISIEPIDEQRIVDLRHRTEPRHFPSRRDSHYELRSLARLVNQPQVKGFEFTVLTREGSWLQHSLHQYVYNFGDTTVRLCWNDEYHTELYPGDSAYCRPMTRHKFSATSGQSFPRLFVVRVPGFLTSEALDEYATFDPDRRSRTVLERSTWF